MCSLSINRSNRTNQWVKYKLRAHNNALQSWHITRTVWCFDGRTGIWRPREPCGATFSMDKGQREQGSLSRAAREIWGFQKPTGKLPNHSPLYYNTHQARSPSQCEQEWGAWDISKARHWLDDCSWLWFVQIYLHIVSAQRHLAIFWLACCPCRMNAYIYILTVIHQ